MKISAIVMTLNEESNIDRCLSSLAFADEIVVLDSFSTDRTVEIARNYTNKVAQQEFKSSSGQRLAATEMTSNEWLLFVDADEVVTVELAEEICQAVKSEKYAAYRLPRLTYFLGKPIRGCGWYPDPVVRLMRKSKAQWSFRLVHESAEIDGRVGDLSEDLLHYSFNDLESIVRKTHTYARLSAQQKVLEGKDFQLYRLVFGPVSTFIKKYILQQGYRDGVRGLIISGFCSVGSFMRYAMLWELTRHRSTDK